MKNFILKNGDAIINYGAWICSGIIALGCFIIFMNFLDLSRECQVICVS